MRGRRRGEMRRRIVIGGMVIGLLMGCNNGGELEAEKRLSAIGRSAENVFYSFMYLIADSLGFTVKADTTKQAVGEHFGKLGIKLGEVSNKLEEVAVKAVTDGDKEGILNKAIREAVDAAKATLNTLKTHVDILGTVGGTNVVGWAVDSQQGVKVAEPELKKAYDALKGIVETAKKQQVKEPSASSVTLQASSIGVASPENGAKILATDGPGTAVGGIASLIVAAVSGEEMLESIVKSKGAEKALTGAASEQTTPFEFALGGTNGNVANAKAKSAAVAGGIALRSLVKDGKLGANGSDDGKAAHAAGITAVNKLLGAVEDIIKKTVKNVIEKAKTEIDKARDSKATVQ